MSAPINPVNARYVLVGPKEKKEKDGPGLYDHMPFRKSSSSPFPLVIECVDRPTALLMYSHLQRWFKDCNHWDCAPRTAAREFVDSKEFKAASEIFETDGRLIWAVKQGRRAGIYHNTVEALDSVDSSGARKDGRIFQLAYAFYSFREASLCQMLNDHPRTAVHVYSPSQQPAQAATLRSQLLQAQRLEAEPPSDSTSEAESPEPSPSPSPPPTPATPKQKPSASSSKPSLPSSGSFNINFSPTVAVRVNSEPTGRLSPTKQKAGITPKGVELGRRLLECEGYSPAARRSVEEVLMSCTSVDDFVEFITDGDESTLTPAKASLVWDLYKLV
ncbi:hypothetical protein F5880DRAFT_1617915 [Lentinula raphanica]|nr:hypothetical protein F5880DRAFT_1617915 [Lentinula raphanica]